MIDDRTRDASIAMMTRDADFSAWHVVVAGIGIAGYAAADALMQLGARVSIVDSADGPAQRERGTILAELGAEVRLGVSDPIPDADLLVVSPGLPPQARVIVDAQFRGIPVWGELELAWRLRKPRPDGSFTPWLTVTGTNGKTTTTLMLASMLGAAGYRVAAAGNIGTSLIDVVMHEDLDVIAVEVGAPQLPFVTSMSPVSSACLNFAEDHVDHFGSLAEYRRAKERVFHLTQVAAIYNAEDPETERMVRDADVIDGCRAVAFTLGVPAVSMVGVVDDVLVDRAFLPERRSHARELAQVSDVHPAARHNVANALAAAALALSWGVPPGAVRQGLIDFTPAGHRIAEAGVVDGVRYVDDSKATNAHAAQMSLLSYDPVVWIAGGMAKGQAFDDLIAAVQARLRGVVLLGVDRAVIADALRRVCPGVPVVEISGGEASAMTDVVLAAQRMSQPGDTVLLAPGCASWDMFKDYAHRGEAFTAAVRALAREGS